MNKYVYFGLIILEVSKTVMYKFWKSQIMLDGCRHFHCPCKSKTNLWRFPRNFEKSFDKSNYELERLLPKVKNELFIGLMKDELGICRIKRAKRDKNDESKNQKVQICAIKRRLCQDFKIVYKHLSLKIR